jgi:acyl-CoA thioester hydrolase
LALTCPLRQGSKSLDMYFTLSMSGAPDVVSANGVATLVWLDFPNKKTVPLPDDLRAACG